MTTQEAAGQGYAAFETAITTPPAVRRYIDSIRNPAKRAYADAYYRDCVRRRLPEPDRGSMSYMAAQAVRMRLAELAKGES